MERCRRLRYGDVGKEESVESVKEIGREWGTWEGRYGERGREMRRGC